MLLQLANKLPVLCIVGTTATGKSDLGVRLAQAVNGEVISADSMQIYSGMDIGTAKLTIPEMGGIRHHLLDLVSPAVSFSVAEWTYLADLTIGELHQAGKLPIVVGGTGLYIRAITTDLDFANRKGDPEIRSRWQTFMEANGKEALHQELQSRDPASAARLHPNDTRRVIRALEIAELGDQPLSEAYDWNIREGRYATLQIGLRLPRETLYERINLRVDRMLEKGLVDEVSRLLDAGFDASSIAMQAIGYKELVLYLTGLLSYEEAVHLIKQATRRFAKRQLSWFSRDARIHWVDLQPDGTLEMHTFSKLLHQVKDFSAGIHVY